MCGIVGAAGSIYNQEKKAFEDMLIFSQQRGPHSTGIASVDRTKDDLILMKALGRPDALIDYDKRYDRALGYNKKFLLGHNRWATMGAVTKRNAHPFTFDNIVGCHNGTIPENRLKDLKKGPEFYGTDSETVLANINEYPLKDVFGKLTGAWVFVWFDTRDNSLNFIRNSARELYYTYSKDRKAIFWASEKCFIEAALTRNKIEYGEIYGLVEDKHFMWEIPEQGKEFELPTQTDVASYKYEVTEHAGRFRPGNNGNVGHGGDVISMYNRHNRGAHGGANQSGPIYAKKVEVKDFCPIDGLSNRNFDGQGYTKGKKSKELYKGWNGELLNEAAFLNATKDDCAWCTTPALWGRPVRFISKTEHLCLDCAGDELVKQAYI